VKTAILILGHGSKNMSSDDAFRRIADEVKQLGGYDIVEHAFLQYAAPTPQDALKQCIRQKADRIVIVPFFMQAGTHVTRDIPELIRRAAVQYPGISIVVTDYVGTHPLLSKIVLDLVQKKN
jgi:sirohydrochlorin ferrochelatase